MQQTNMLSKIFLCVNKDGQAEFINYDSMLQGETIQLLCKGCYEKKSLENSKALPQGKAFDEAQQQFNLVWNRIETKINKISELVQQAQVFRSQFLSFFDQFFSYLDQWQRSLTNLNEKSKKIYELNYFNTKLIQQQEKLFNSSNQIYITKLCNRFRDFNLNCQREQQKFSILLTQLIKETQNIVPNQIQNVVPDQTQNVVPDQKIELKIDSIVPQQECCLNIAFNSSNSIMISTQVFNILTWTFNMGKIKTQQSLIKHKDWVNCIVYSKEKEVFFSGSDDKTIIIWQLQENGWRSSKPFEKHQVNCLLLNQKEDQLFSCGNNHQIIVWKINLEMNELIYQYELNKHKSSVFSMSLNQSESTLVSCGDEKHEIIVWEKGKDNKMKFKYFVKQQQSQNYFGKKLFFLSEKIFIWVTATKEVDKIFVFEIKNEVFQENQQKTIELIQEKEQDDMFLFPIIREKNSNMIIIRHKTHIYFLKDLGSGKLKIAQQINCETTHIYGTITNNLSHLLYWDNKTGGYKIYQIKQTEQFLNL
ncbi:unnamed protein product [Paramecium pentaurelia]|uniref:WD40-repeat-containing domain n=1 Tax=Paramecium pentaurelia TaxID=43138 RepID=A0A8S1T4A9_9CILI|nr:unnamed protein product [Paramecium pentaurelia]